MSREELVRGIIAMIFTAVVALVTGCGGETVGVARHIDVADAAAGGTGASGSAGASSGGSSGSGLVACNDGTGNTDCCPPSAVDGGPCDVGTPRCSRGGCHGGFMSYLYCGADGIWIAGHGLIPCSVDAGLDGSVSQMSCSDLHAAWTSFWENHGQCTTDTDCTTFLAIDPSSSPCDAPPGLNQTVNKLFVGDTQQYADRYFQLACGGDQNTRPNARNGLWSDFGYDGTALVNPRCISGSCSAESLSCNPGPPPDGGGPKACRDIDEAHCPLGRCQLLPICNGTSLCYPPFSGSPPTCGALSYYGVSVPCCAGLVKRCGAPPSDGSCEQDAGGNTNIPMCIACGDGFCDTTFENRCNCPEDCH